MPAGCRRSATAVVRNGIPLPNGSADRERPGRTFLLLTRLTVEKGVRVVLQAIAALPRTLDFRLVIAGRGPLEDEMRQAAADDPRIQIRRAMSPARRSRLCSKQADYLLVPSLWYENAPVAVIEAAAYGVAVIASRIGGLPEFVREGRTGLLFEPGDATGLAAIMHGLLQWHAGDWLIRPGSAGTSRSSTRSIAWSNYISTAIGICSRHATPTGRADARRMEMEHAA